MSIKRIGDSAISAMRSSITALPISPAMWPRNRSRPSVYEQTKNILKQIDETLKQAGSDKTKILKTNNLALRHVDLRRDEQGLGRVLPKGHAPARATVESKLADPKWKVEIMMIAAV